jgi:DNA polymerase III gamma/tau subunit
MTTFRAKHEPIFFRDFHGHATCIRALTALLNADQVKTLLLGDAGVGKSSLARSCLYEYYGADVDLSQIWSLARHRSDQRAKTFLEAAHAFCATPSLRGAKRKVMLLDDFDTLPACTQNALWACANKHLANVHVVAVVTNLAKVSPAGMLSHLHLVNVDALTLPEMGRMVTAVASREKFDVPAVAVMALLDASDGSVGAVLNQCEKLMLCDDAMSATHLEFNDHVPVNAVHRCLAECSKGDRVAAIGTVRSLYLTGFCFMDILDRFQHVVSLATIAEVTITDGQRLAILTVLAEYMAVHLATHEDSMELSCFVNDVVDIVAA